MIMTESSKILITGGTGSLGKALVQKILEKHPKIKRLVIFSRDELKQFEMQMNYSQKKFPGLRFFIGDIRDKGRLEFALKDIDFVIHAAALKHVPTAEYNPFEFIKTNVLGAQNLIEACFKNGVKKVVALSTDKASSPINLYGASKLCADKLFIAANNIRGSQDISFSTVRYGNVMGSRGSVIPYFLEKRSEGFLPITHRDMTRFNITLEQGVKTVIWTIENSIGGEIIVPKIPSYKILDLAKAIAPHAQFEFTGIRPGEKLHEEMISESDSMNVIDEGIHYVIIPNNGLESNKKYLNHFSGKFVQHGFKYSSDKNSHFLSVDEIEKLITIHVESNFK